MSARIAPDPIAATVGPPSEYRARPNSADQPIVQPAPPSSGADGATISPSDTNAAPTATADDEAGGTRFADILPPLPKPPAPPGTMFAAAVLAGALSPKPETPEEIFLRLGTAEWEPPESDLRLADRTA